MNFSSSSNFSNNEYIEVLYCYNDVSGSCEKIARPLSLQFSMFLIMGLAILVTIFGNLLVIVSVVHFKQLHTTTNHFILSLAFCDFVLGAFVMPCSAVRSVQGCWFLGDFVCKLHSSTDIMLCTCSIFHLYFISVDRYIAICTPLLYRSINNSLMTFLMVTASWFISAIFTYGMIFSDMYLKGIQVFFETHVQCVGGCTVFFSRLYIVLSSSLGFFVPGLIMTGLYGKIYTVARLQARSIKDRTEQVQMDNENKVRVSRKTVRRKENTLAMVVGVFFICWTPFFLCYIIDPFIGYSISPMLVDILYWFGYMNSSFNPLLYAFFYSWFRKAFRIILSGRMFHKNSSRVRLYSD